MTLNSRVPGEPKPFRLEGEEHGVLCYQGGLDGPLVIDLNMESFTPAQALRLAEWLKRAAAYATAYNRGRKT